MPAARFALMPPRLLPHVRLVHLWQACPTLRPVPVPRRVADNTIPASIACTASKAGNNCVAANDLIASTRHPRRRSNPPLQPAPHPPSSTPHKPLATDHQYMTKRVGTSRCATGSTLRPGFSGCRPPSNARPSFLPQAGRMTPWICTFERGTGEKRRHPGADAGSKAHQATPLAG